MPNKYEWQPGMGEISGFGGSYEQTCRNMLFAGLQWMDEHPDADPQFNGFKGVFGLINESNADAEALEKAILKAPDADGCTGAMYHAVVSHVLFIKANGWEKYVSEMSAREDNE